jgi:hypothetical protein
MYEKYNAYEVGVGGGGGEYTPQIGFGWSNAVALILINDTYRDFIPPIIHTDDDAGSNDSSSSNVALIASLAVILPLLGIGVLAGAYYYYKIYLPKKYDVDERSGLVMKLV